MRRTISILGVLALIPVGVVASVGGMASASIVLTGSTNCTLTQGGVTFNPGLAAVTSNGDEKVEVFGGLSCTTANVPITGLTSLTGEFKGIIKFKKATGANKARECANFNGAVPNDKIVAVSRYVVAWTTNLGAALASTVTYLHAYSAVGSATSMNLNFTPTTAAVTGSFAGTTALLDYILPIVTPQCPVAAGPVTATAGSLVM
jgi:hypothetical protein